MPGFPWFEAAVVLLVLLLIALFINWITFPSLKPGQPVLQVSLLRATVCMDASWAAEILMGAGIVGLVAWLLFGSRRESSAQDHDAHDKS